LKTDHFAVLRGRLVEPAELMRGKSKVVMRAEQVGIQLERLPMLHDSILETAHSLKSAAHIVVRFSVVRIQAQRLLQMRCRFIELIGTSVHEQ